MGGLWLALWIGGEREERYRLGGKGEFEMSFLGGGGGILAGRLGERERIHLFYPTPDTIVSLSRFPPKLHIFDKVLRVKSISEKGERRGN